MFWGPRLPRLVLPVLPENGPMQRQAHVQTVMLVLGPQFPWQQLPQLVGRVGLAHIQRRAHLAALVVYQGLIAV